MDGILDGGITAGTVRSYTGATGRDLHLDVPLSNLSIAYEPQGLIAPLISPIVSVDKETNLYYIWPKGESLRSHPSYRARGRQANRISFDVSSDSYAVKNYALAMEIPYEDLDNADTAIDIRGAAARRVVNALNLAWEDRLATTLTTTTNMSSAVALSNNWADLNNSDPISDIFAGRDSIRRTTGYTPNTILFSDQAWSRFSRHPDVVEFVRGKGDSTGGGPVVEGAVASAFGVDRIVIGKGLKASGAEGATATYTDIWSTAVVLMYVANAPSLMEPSFMYTFRWTPSGFPGPLAVERYPDQRHKTESVEVHLFQDEKVTGADLGYLIVGA